jgi:hypothetical protein
MEKTLKCPCCAADLHCGCKFCYPNNKHNPLLLFDGDIQYCSECGFRMHNDDWLDYEYELVFGGQFS